MGMRDGGARLSGTLWWLTPDDLALSASAWEEELDHLQALGIDTIIFNGPFAGPEGGAAFDALLERLDVRGLHVYLDMLSAPDWWRLEGAGEEVRRASDRATALQQAYGHHASFTGFYIPYECYVMWGRQGALVRDLYAGVSDGCKMAAPEKPVMISPFFRLDKACYLGDFQWATPEEYAVFWRDILSAASIDIVALQDSGEHLSSYTLAQRRPFFEAMAQACSATGTSLWANVESGELHVASLEDYAARFGLKTPVNSPETEPFWRAVPAEKFRAKLSMAGEYTDTAITWGYREFLRPSRGLEAAQAYDGYVRVFAR
ncbi:MAG TPA: DUF4434 domain-containing protein [Candidatus Hydrogenedentes bacterium]|nr:DUF4434 domain-containing protein [Candidatus Hydrogenedentota bacterium]